LLATTIRTVSGTPITTMAIMAAISPILAVSDIRLSQKETAKLPLLGSAEQDFPGPTTLTGPEVRQSESHHSVIVTPL
jgi:hypothetical protein